MSEYEEELEEQNEKLQETLAEREKELDTANEKLERYEETYEMDENKRVQRKQKEEDENKEAWLLFIPYAILITGVVAISIICIVL